MRVNLIRWPDQHDWNRCKLLALGTEGKEAKTSATLEWKRDMLKCEHSPIRTLMFTIQLVDVPYWVSVHFVRHKIGVEHFVKSQRNDRQNEYDRNSALQNAPVNHILDVNAEELMFMARRRLCSKAAAETKQVMEMIVEAVVDKCPEFNGFFVPQCEYLGRCIERHSCGMFEDNQISKIGEGFTGNEYQKLAMRTCSIPYDDKKGRLNHAIFGLASEAGEAAGILQKEYQGHSVDVEHMKKELGDCMWMIAEACTALGFTLEDVMQTNIDKLRARYPDGFEVDKSLHRKEGDI